MTDYNAFLPDAKALTFGVGEEEYALSISGLVLPHQTHSLNVKVIDKISEMELADTDALITQQPGQWIGVRTADCVPILLCAPGSGAVAAVHAGWKGTIGNIVGRTVDHLVELGAAPANIKALIAPCISSEAYEVDPEFALMFERAGYWQSVIKSDKWPKPHVDLAAANVRNLSQAGVCLKNITLTNLCSRLAVDSEGAPVFYSYRRDKTTLRNITMISLPLDNK